mmetsp:Transcript_63280/g.142716  ORF Transcript_63280/g.142716 Transcript_63280/m.142716 type:complete len:273 (-) Transcript_63280:2256-3074(-)
MAAAACLRGLFFVSGTARLGVRVDKVGADQSERQQELVEAPQRLAPGVFGGGGGGGGRRGSRCVGGDLRRGGLLRLPDPVQGPGRGSPRGQHPGPRGRRARPPGGRGPGERRRRERRPRVRAAAAAARQLGTRVGAGRVNALALRPAGARVSAPAQPDLPLAPLLVPALEAHLRRVAPRPARLLAARARPPDPRQVPHPGPGRGRRPPRADPAEHRPQRGGHGAHRAGHGPRGAHGEQPVRERLQLRGVRRAGGRPQRAALRPVRQRPQSTE